MLRPSRDGAPAAPPPNLAQVPDAVPRVEPIRVTGSTSTPYAVFGQTYVPMTDDRPFHEVGLASWYGTKFHGVSTASGEIYDLYAMTAAHKTMPLPSYVRVYNPANGRQVIVRVNDRGPFAEGRIIDLSYVAAYKLGVLRGVTSVVIDRITNDDIRTGAWMRDNNNAAAAMPLDAAMPPAAAPAPQPSPPEPAPVTREQAIEMFLQQ
jgi:rare lipoprotein A